PEAHLIPSDEGVDHPADGGAEVLLGEVSRPEEEPAEALAERASLEEHELARASVAQRRDAATEELEPPAQDLPLDRDQPFDDRPGAGAPHLSRSALGRVDCNRFEATGIAADETRASGASPKVG